MKTLVDLRAENDALRKRLSRLSEASLRLNESLDLDTVLRGALENARLLTGASYALITTVDGVGQVEDFLVSGLTAPEAEQLWEMPEGLEIFGYLSTLSGPLRVRDFGEHVLSLGLPEFLAPGPVSSFLAAPIRHRGRNVGNVYVAQREPGLEFTREDEEALVMVASQAALVIENARSNRDEQRARAELETLVDTSPVGMVVCDARTGTVVLFNREAARILDRLRIKDCPVEQLLEVLTIQRSDGREMSLEDVSLAQALAAGGTVRAEEVVFQVPDGRSVAVMMNATPIPGVDGKVKTYVVTLQDMAPFEELEQMRSAFLGMVSHELRAPLSSIKGSAATLLASGASLDPAEMVLFFRIIDQQADQMSRLISDLLDAANIEGGGLSVVPAPVEAKVLVDDARNTFLSGGGRHSIVLDVAPDLHRVMADRRRIVQVLGNLLSNAARHSPESAPIRVSATSDGTYVVFSVADHGRGVSPDALPRLFAKFYRINHNERRDTLGGTGLGLAICKGIVEAHGGRIWAESEGPYLGTRFTFTLPTAGETLIVDPTVPSRAGGLPGPTGRGRFRILAVDDDPQTLRYVRDTLREEGYAPTVTGDPQQVKSLIAVHRPHLVLLDLMLPGEDGIRLLARVPELARIPVIFLSAYGKDHTIARALEAGAVDYIVKPFSPTELLARVQVALRQQEGAETDAPPEPYQFGELTINYATRTVFLAGDPLQLTSTEYRLLFELSANGGRTVSHDHLLRQVWGFGHNNHSGPIRTTIKNLRRKLGDSAKSPTYLFNEPRVGYRMPRSQTQPPG